MADRKPYTKPLLDAANEDEVIAHFARADLAAEPVPPTTLERAREAALLAAVLGAVRRRGGDPMLASNLQARITTLELGP